MTLSNYLKWYFLQAHTDSKDYWNTRWTYKLSEDTISPERRAIISKRVHDLMSEHDCESVLEVGCGAHPLLDDGTHLDFSLRALELSGLSEFICADVTKCIPVPDKTFDCTFSSCTLMHLPTDIDVSLACFEIERVTKKLIVLNENDSRPKFERVSVEKL